MTKMDERDNAGAWLGGGLLGASAGAAGVGAWHWWQNEKRSKENFVREYRKLITKDYNRYKTGLKIRPNVNAERLHQLVASKNIQLWIQEHLYEFEIHWDSSDDKVEALKLAYDFLNKAKEWYAENASQTRKGRSRKGSNTRSRKRGKGRSRKSSKGKKR